MTSRSNQIGTQAEQIAADEARENGWPDAKQEIARDLFVDDEAFANAVVAQQHLAMFDSGIEASSLAHEQARLGAENAADIRELRVERISEQADEVIELATRLGVWPEWTDAYDAYQCGFKSVDSLRGTTLDDLKDAGLHPKTASRLLDAVSEVSSDA